ncbi:MAG: tetratricopeptide repeat protein [Candidatus Lokiarchaeota archaeon]
MAKQHAKEMEKNIKKSFWSNFLIGGLLVSGLFLVVDSLQLNWPTNLTMGFLILILGGLLLASRYMKEKRKESKGVRKIKNLKVESLKYKGGIRFYKKNYGEATIIWDEALNLISKIPEILNGKGAILSNSRSLKEAIPYFNKTLKYEKKNISIWMNKGITSHKLKDFNTTVKCYNKVIKIDPIIKKLGRIGLSP